MTMLAILLLLMTFVNSGASENDLTDEIMQMFQTNDTSSSYREGFKHLWRNMTRREAVVDKVPPFYSNVTSVDVYMQVFQIISVNDDQQTINLKMSFGVNWTDPELAWDPNDYSGIEKMKLAPWKPFVLIPEAIQNDHLILPELMFVDNTGNAGVSDAYVVEILCFLDMDTFPFDRHNCGFSLIMDAGIEPNFVKEKDMKLFNTKGEWELLSQTCQNAVSKSRGSPVIVCSVCMQRMVTFYVANILVPMTLSSVVTLMVFLIPAETGEKTGFLLNIYVSTSVFLNFIVDFLPKSMTTIPRINLLLLFQVIEIIMATVATLFVTSRYKSFIRKEAENRSKNNILKCEKQANNQHNDDVRGKFLGDDDAENKMLNNDGGHERFQCENMQSKEKFIARWMRILKKLFSPSERLTHTELDRVFLVVFSVTIVVVTVSFVLSSIFQDQSRKSLRLSSP